MERNTVSGREVDLYTPATVRGERSPLVIALHGGLGNAAQFAQTLPLRDAAEAGAFRVAYLNGTITTRRARADRRAWNAGSCCGSASARNVDDVGYIAQVISALVRESVVDPGRVYLIGHSNGAMMAYRVACERPDLIRGIVAISGPLAMQTCRNARGVRVLHIHGGADEFVPIEGGGGFLAQSHNSLRHTVERVRAAGAVVDVRVLESAGHRLEAVDAAARRELGAPLSALIAAFVREG